jgi:hypothetical protein
MQKRSFSLLAQLLFIVVPQLFKAKFFSSSVGVAFSARFSLGLTSHKAAP